MLKPGELSKTGGTFFKVGKEIIIIFAKQGGNVLKLGR